MSMANSGAEADIDSYQCMRRFCSCPAVFSSPSTSTTSAKPSPSTASCSAPSRPSSGPATPTSPSPSRRSSWCCWKTPARAAASTTSASRSPTSARSRPSWPVWPRPGSLRVRRGRPPAATPSRTSSGCRALRTVRAGRSTPSWRTARPSTQKATESNAAAAPTSIPRRRRLQQPRAASRPGGCHTPYLSEGAILMTSAAEVVVIGAGQSGLAAVGALQPRGISPVVLEAGDRAAGSWPCYYDSLKAFSPAGFNAMPGMPFPGDPDRYPARDEVADYLDSYAAALGVEIHTGTRVAAVGKDGRDFVVVTADGRRLRAAGVVAASGSFSSPYRPAFLGQESFTGELSHVAEY